MDHELIEEMHFEYNTRDTEYLSNSIDESRLTVPDRYDIEIFSTKILQSADTLAILESQREHDAVDN